MTEQETAQAQAQRDAEFAAMQARAAITKRMMSEIKAKLRAQDEESAK